VIERQALNIAQIQEAQPKAPGTVVFRQPRQPICDQEIVIIPLGLVSVAVFTDFENPAGHSD
jgi:hypothetical protein